MRYTNTHKFFDNLITLLSVFSTGGLLFVFNRNDSYFLFFGVLLFTFIFLGKRLNRKIFHASLMTYLSIISIVAINYLCAISEQSINKYGYYFMVITVSVLTITHFLNNRKLDFFLERLYFILKLILFHSALNFIAYFLFKGDLVNISSPWSGTEYAHFNYLFYFSTKELGIINLYGIEFARNHGLFWEPGILQIYLNILFFLEAFIFQRSRFLLLATALVILTTYSTTGIGILLLLSVVYVFREQKKRKYLIPLLLSACIPVYIIFSLNVEEKISGERENSFQKRLFDLTQPFFIALEYPLTGIGMDIIQFQQMRQEFHFSSSTLESFGLESKMEFSDKGSSNSIMFLFASMGFPTALLLLYMFFKQQIIIRRKSLFMLIVVFFVMSEPLLLRPFFFMFIVSGFIHTFRNILTK